MRDPARIVKILARLQSVWAKSPDLRLGQLILNLDSYTKKPLYSMEDEDLIEALESMYKPN